VEELNDEKALKSIVSRLSEIGKWEMPHLPCDYLVVDIETTGFSSINNRIVSVGLCAVRDCEITDELHDGNSANIILKWPEEVFHDCQTAIDVHGIDYERSQAEGVDPKEAMGIVADAIRWAKSEGMFFVGHNLLKFDVPFLGMELSRAGFENRIDGTEVVDTAALCKAMQLGVFPGSSESIYEYFTRVINFRARGIYFNLDKYCVNRFDLVRNYGVDINAAHDSGYDCWLTHLVLQEMNKIVGYIATPF
jgi:DNA polymerase III epsilon subunit-like protein